jgi:hypothetical protein
MIEDRALRTARRTVADYRNNSIAGPRGPIVIDDFQPLERFTRGEHNQRVTVVSGSAVYDTAPVMIDVTDYTEIESDSASIGRTDRFLRSVAGPLLTFAAAAVVAITISILPAPDRPTFPDGPLAGHSLLHFPR